jgi:type VI secretion system protein ImpM
VPQALTSAADAGFLRNAAIGFHGKIPARGDFVHAGLPRTFTDPWDEWMQRMVGASRSVLGQAWLPAWLEAAIWRFALTPGTCGPHAVIGLWMPSVDRIGRYFPLTLAAVARDADTPALTREGGGFLAAAERAGRDALQNDLAPDELAARLAAAAAAQPGGPGTNPSLCPLEGGLWWTEGAPRVPAWVFVSRALPDENAFVAMLVVCLSTTPSFAPAQAR